MILSPSHASRYHQSVRADAACQGMKITRRQRAAPHPVLHRHRARRQAHRAGRLRTRRASSRWPSSSISTTTSTNTRTRTTSRPSCTPQPLHLPWWEHLRWTFLLPVWNVYETFNLPVCLKCFNLLFLFSVWEVSRQNGRIVPTSCKYLVLNGDNVWQVLTRTDKEESFKRLIVYWGVTGHSCYVKDRVRF